MVQGKHVAETPNWWQRRKRWQKVVVILAAFMAASGTALAIWLASFGATSGTFSFTIDPDANFTLQPGAVEDFSTDCAGEVSPDGLTFTLTQWDNIGPNDGVNTHQCGFRINVDITDTNTGIYPVDVDVANSNVVATMSSGSPSTGDSCGHDISVEATPQFKVAFKVADGLDAGSYSWSLAGDDAFIFASDPADGDCTSLTDNPLNP